MPVDVRNFENPLKDMALVALAGPASNFLRALAWTLVLVFFKTAMPESEFGFYMGFMALIGVWFNLLLMILNLIPVPPLDGGRVVSGVLPTQLGWYYTRIEAFGMWVVIFLFITGILGKILMPMVKGVQQQLFSLFGL